MSASRYYARRPVPGYGGEELDQGQVLTLGGFVNDEKLVRLGYLQPFNGGDTARCRLCGKEFVDQRSRQQHGDFRHVDRALTPEQQDAREEKRQSDAPAPFLDRTSASLGVKPDGVPEVTTKKAGSRKKTASRRAAHKEA